MEHRNELRKRKCAVCGEGKPRVDFCERDASSGKKGAATCKACVVPTPRAKKRGKGRQPSVEEVEKEAGFALKVI